MNIETDIQLLNIEKRAFINGNYQSAQDNTTITKTSPVDGRDLSGLSQCGEQEVNQAVASAQKAFEQGIWSQQPVVKRKSVMLQLARLMEQHRYELALLDTLETGRAFANFFYDSIPKAIEALRYFAEGIDKIYDQSITAEAHSAALLSREPLGVVAAITPWNDPLVVSVWKFAPALLMGNSIIIKPAEQSSFSILKVAQLAQQAGVPDGVLQVLPGDGSTGKLLAKHPQIRGVFFTGSSAVGKKILQYAGQSNMKRVALECGGKSAYIVSRNCRSIERAAKVLAKNMFYNQGQICSAPSRLFIDHSIQEAFTACLKKEMCHYEPAHPFEEDTRVGCVVSEEQKTKIEDYIQYGKETALSRYQIPQTRQMPEKSCYVLPVLFEFESTDNRLMQEEIFGPVLSMVAYEHVQQAIEWANQSEYGLAAAIWSHDLDEVHQVTRSLQAGLVHVNSYGDDDNRAPFGGIKQSGIGKDKSIYSFDEYSYLKTTWFHYGDI